MSMKLYCTVGSSRGTKCLVAAELVKANVELVPVTNEEIKKNEFKKKNPLNKIPVLETEQGNIFESNAILRFLARSNPESKLYGNTLFEQGQVDQWLDFVNNEIDPLSFALLYSVLVYSPVDPELQKKATTDLSERFKILDFHLKDRQYLVGTSVTIADLALASIVYYFYVLSHNEKQRKSNPNLLKWYENISTHEAWVKHYGRTRYLKIAFPAVKIEGGVSKPEQEQKQEKKPAQKEEKKQVDQKPKKEEQVKADQTKKEVAKKTQPKDDEEEEEDVTTEVKRVNPLDHLPKSTFNIDDYKRLFFASKDIAGSIQLLFDTIDNEGWSLWLVNYEKAEGEGVNLLKTTNTMRGFLQRTDPHFKKHSFAIWGVYGDDKAYEIQGAWLWRGVEVPFEFTDHPSYDYHKFVKVDTKNIEQRKLWADYWINQTEDESKVNGLTVRELQYWR